MAEIDYVLGIDPGATGAIALYCPQVAQVLSVIDTPHIEKTLTTGKKSKRVDVPGMRKIIDNAVGKAIEHGATLHAHIEDVQAFGKQSAPAAFNFGYAAGLVYGICVAYDIDVHLVHPAKWKNQFGLKASAKDDARLLARQLFPYLKDKLARKLDVDRADAILLSVYKR